jgi:hypothetical protein
MFYRPDFCCGCGEKIERTDWKPWTSTRFCDLCSTDHPFTEIGPKVLAVVGVLAACLGIGSFMKSPPAPEPRIARKNLTPQSNESVPTFTKFKTTDALANQSQPSSPIENTNVSKPLTPAGKPAADPQMASEPIYFCGAETKKGTPCTRKVKGNVRCWQHRGMPAMAPPGKLLVSR